MTERGKQMIIETKVDGTYSYSVVGDDDIPRPISRKRAEFAVLLGATLISAKEEGVKL